MNEIYETATRWLGANPHATILLATGLVLFALLTAWPLRRVWRWWRAIPSKRQQLEAILNAPESKAHVIAAGYAASGQAPDESKRPITEHRCRELINERHEALDKRRFDRIYDRLAALEAAQKPAPPKVTSGGSGFVAPVWPSGCGVGGIGGAPAWANGLYIEPRSNRSATGVWRVGESYLTSPQGVLIRGHWWRAFKGLSITFVCMDGDEVAFQSYGEWISAVRQAGYDQGEAHQFANSTSFTELPAHETVPLVLDWLARGKE